MQIQEDFAEIDRFVLSVGHGSLFEYLEIDPEAATSRLEQALQGKRQWAQAQQSNPKYKQEALWIIKHMTLCRDALLEKSDRYREHLNERENQAKLDVLQHFIDGAVATGEVTTRGVQTIQEQALRQGLDPVLVQELIDKAMESRGIVLGPGHDPDFVDHYEVLGLHPEADLNEVELSYREKYGRARRLSDSRDAQQEYARLDMAWDVLRDEKARIAFDELRRIQQRTENAHGDGHAPLSSHRDQLLRGVPGAMHRAPGELETQLAPAASTEGIHLAKLTAPSPEDQAAERPTPPPARPSKSQIRFVETGDAPPEPRSNPTPAVPRTAAPSRTSKSSPPARIPLSARRGLSPFLILALGVLLTVIAFAAWFLKA